MENLGHDHYAALTKDNGAFSKELPLLQVAWDSTSLGALKRCPRYYYYTLVLGKASKIESADLRFGIEFHSALENYDRLKATGLTHDEATLATLRQAMIATWNFELNRPWSTDLPYKNRETLVRTILWYLEQFANDPLETVILADGAPAVELSFRFETGLETLCTGESYLFCGHLDRLARFDGKTWIVDRKTTRYAVDQDYFDKYSPDNQMSMYSLGGSMVWHEPIKGLIIDAGQVGVGYTRFQRGFVTRTLEQQQEWFADTQVWLRMAEAYAQTAHYPMNDTACNMYRGCQFRRVCGSSPEVREPMLRGLYDQRMWDPLKTREV